MRLVPPVAVQDLADVFAACDVVAYPDGTSMSSLEAAACGRVVVMNDRPASLWRAEMGDGVLFSERDVVGLRELLRSLVDDGAARGRIGAHAQSSVLPEFSYDKVARQLEDDMARAIAGGTGSSLDVGSAGRPVPGRLTFAREQSHSQLLDEPRWGFRLYYCVRMQ